MFPLSLRVVSCQHDASDYLWLDGQCNHQRVYFACEMENRSIDQYVRIHTANDALLSSVNYSSLDHRGDNARSA